MARIDKIKQALKGLEAEDKIALHNLRNSEMGYSDDDIYPNDEDFFNMYYSNDPYNAVQRAVYGNYQPMQDYVMFDGYGNLKSLDTYDLEKYMSDDEIAEFLDENEQYIEDYLEVEDEEKNEVSEEAYYDSLEVLPPFYFDTLNGKKVSGGFAVGEATANRNTPDGNKATYSGFYKSGDKYFEVGEVYFMQTDEMGEPTGYSDDGRDAKTIDPDAFGNGGGVRQVNGKYYPIGSSWTKEHNYEDKNKDYEVPQADRKRKFAGGGGLKKPTYIPNEDIESLKTNYGQTISGRKLLDGAYATGKVKKPTMSRTQFEDESYEYGNGGFVSKGELVWKKLSSAEKMNFLIENFTPQITPRSQEILVGKSWNFLPKDVKIVFQSKYANVEDYGTGGKPTTNEGIINSFLTTTKEYKVNNLSTHYSTLANVMLLRNYGTIIAKRTLHNRKIVYLNSTKYSRTTTKLTNEVRYQATKLGLKIVEQPSNQFESGGNVGTGGTMDSSTFKKGGGVGKKYILLGYSATASKDDYEQGELESVGDWDTSLSEEFSNKKDLINYINEKIIYVDYEENDFDWETGEGKNIQTDVLCSYDDYNGYFPASEEQKKLWKKGKKDLFNVHYFINVQAIIPTTFKKGGYTPKEPIAFSSSNLYFNGYAMDINGNSVVRVSFPNSRAFSIQTNGTLPKTNNAYGTIGFDESEINSYVKSYGSPAQKKKLKIYKK